jgi:hypothetical protein
MSTKSAGDLTRSEAHFHQAAQTASLFKCEVTVSDSHGDPGHSRCRTWFGNLGPSSRITVESQANHSQCQSGTAVNPSSEPCHQISENCIQRPSPVRYRDSRLADRGPPMSTSSHEKNTVVLRPYVKPALVRGPVLTKSTAQLPPSKAAG